MANGPENAITFLDIDAIEVEQRVRRRATKFATWRDSATGFGTSGTLVVWSKLDRCQWKTGIILRNTGAGGAYVPVLLVERRVEIRFATFDADNVRSRRGLLGRA